MTGIAKSPMLADHDSVHTFADKLQFPLYASPKIDGYRCIVREGRAVSRKLINIPNRHIFKALSIPELEGFDGELIAGGTHANIFNATSSAVSREHGEPAFEWHVFDDSSIPSMPYNARQVRLGERILELVSLKDGDGKPRFPFLHDVVSVRLETWEGLAAFEEKVITLGFEGVITRHPERAYKFGRATQKEQGMLKLKRFTDAEAEVIGFVEAVTNTNPDLRDNLGHAKRSKAQAGLVAADTLGTLQCRDLATGVEFEIGMFKGLTLGDKKQIWDNRADYLGKLVKYQHLAHGALDKPRHSKFLGWRDRADQ